MRNMRLLAVALAIVVCISAEKLEDAGESKPAKKLNTVVVEPKSTVKATPVLETAQLTVSSETPQLSGSVADESPPDSGVPLSTKTIYGFLDFVTTVGNTVMVFTPGAGTPAGAETAEPAPASVAPSPSRTAPEIAATASEPLPERHLRFTTTEPAPSAEEVTEEEVTEPPTAPGRKGKNLLWAKLRDRSPKERRPFLLPQRRGLQTARSAAPLPTPPLERQFLLAASPASIVDEEPTETETEAPVSATVTERTTQAALRTVQAGEEFSDSTPEEETLPKEEEPFPTEEGVTRVSSVIHGTSTEFPPLPAPASEPEVLPIERILPTAPSGRPSLQERLKARLQAALESRESRPSAVGERRKPFTLVPEQRARSARQGRPELPLSTRRTPPSRNRGERRLSAADRLKQRLLKQREELSPSEEAPLEDEVEFVTEELPTDEQLQELVEGPQDQEQEQQVLAVNTYRPMDATDLRYELRTIRSLHHNTLGRFTSSRWVTSTETRTVRLSPSAAQRAPALTAGAGALPAGATFGLFGAGLTPSSGSGSGGDNNVVMLPAVQLDPSSPSLPLHTMTETYSTTQLLLKSSVIPLVIGDSTRAFTITQSYQVTRLVTALKTMPPMEVFQTSGPPGLLHREPALLAQGSENQVDELGVPLVRLPPPDDLAAIGLFDVDRHESEMNPEEFKLQHQATAAAAAPTPPLPQLGMLGALAQLTQLSPQQLAYLQLLGPLLGPLGGQPGGLGGLGGGLGGLGGLGAPAAPRTIVTSSPVVYSTIITSLHSQAVVVTFRATPSTAYITSTTVFPTVLTSYVTSTMHVHQPAPVLG